ncbi:uncharacterized protein LOC129222382 [Uloborus diversus]|uniref:uncharacterized protein LOC129222382 n=1 Tax=Uloborus diversus TaxID=327109 RepID=UPI00240A2F92|nr:uncharacterized protein LOC129222382 [Uloborus diversus]
MEKSGRVKKNTIDKPSERTALNAPDEPNLTPTSEVVETDALLSLVEDKIKATEIKAKVRKRSRYDIFKSKNRNSDVSSKKASPYTNVQVDDLITLFKSVENAEINCKIQKVMKPSKSSPEDQATTSNAEENSIAEDAVENEILLDMVIRIPSSLTTNETKELNKVKEEKQCEDTKISKEVASKMEISFSKLKPENNVNVRCQGIFDLAFLYYSEESGKIQPSECFRAVQLLSDSHKNNSLAFCYSMLLCVLTTQPMTWYEMQFLEDSILNFIHLMPKSPENSLADFNASHLCDKGQKATQRLCKNMFQEHNINSLHFDITAILCSSLFNLSTFVKQYCGNIEEEYSYKEKTLKYIFEKTCGASQKLSPTKGTKNDDKLKNDFVISYTIEHCLHIIEHALAINPVKHSSYLHHETLSLHHCLTKLLGWCISIVFSDEKMAVADQESSQKSGFDYHHSTLVSILKIFSILTFNPNEYNTFNNIKGLMEKIMICILKAYFRSAENLFDVLILCLELMVNLFIKNQKTFILLCLKKFKIGNSEEVLAIEALIKMLSETLQKIKEVKAVEIPSQQPVDASNNQENSKEVEKNSELQMVLQAASKDMELSTIAAFTCILITFFMKTKEDFKDYVRQRLPVEVTQDAVDVSKKFMEFATLTGGMPETGLLLLKYAISKLEKLYETEKS